MLTSRSMLGSFNTSDVLNSSETCWIQTAFTATSLALLLPLFVAMVAVGCRRRPEVSSGHSDVFTYHMVAMETVQVLGCVCISVGQQVDIPWEIFGLIMIFYSTFCVKIQFHMLTCIELFVAVVHPVVYLRLKSSGGATIRNVSAACVWLLCVAVVLPLMLWQLELLVVLYFLLIAFALLVVSICCLYVLWTLKRPAPGRQTRVDQSKLRAVHSIAAIMAVLWLSLGGILVCFSVEVSLTLDGNDGCALAQCAAWMSLPSSLVLPVMFLQRAWRTPGRIH